MAPTNIKTDSECCRLPTTSVSAKNRKNYAPTSTSPSTTEIKIEITVLVSSLQSPVHSWKSPTNLARSPLLVALVGRKMTVVRDQLFPQKPPGSSLWFSRTGVQPSPGSSTIAALRLRRIWCYPPDSRVLPGSPRQCSLPLACRHPPEGHQIGAREEARTWEHHHPQPTIPPPRLNRQAESRRQPVGCISWGWARPYTRRKDPPTLIPRNQQVSEGAGTKRVTLINTNGTRPLNRTVYPPSSLTPTYSLDYKKKTEICLNGQRPASRDHHRRNIIALNRYIIELATFDHTIPFFVTRKSKRI